jgi:hypothetical protein
VTTGPYRAAHRHSAHHRAEILASAACGCFHCRAVFAPGAITRWIEAGQTALCPRCGVDAVIGAAAGYPLTPAFLEAMRALWFST